MYVFLKVIAVFQYTTFFRLSNLFRWSWMFFFLNFQTLGAVALGYRGRPFSIFAVIFLWSPIIPSTIFQEKNYAKLSQRRPTASLEAVFWKIYRKLWSIWSENNSWHNELANSNNLFRWVCSFKTSQMWTVKNAGWSHHVFVVSLLSRSKPNR